MTKDIVPRDIKRNQLFLQVADLVNQGKDVKEIAEEMNFSKQRVQRMMRDNVFKAILAAQYKNAMSLTSKKLSGLYKRALEALDEIMDCGDAELILKGVAEIRKLVKQDSDMDKNAAPSDQPFEVVQTQTTTMDPDGKVLSIKEQKQITHKMRESTPEQNER
jgi:hypothetical protein